MRFWAWFKANLSSKDEKPQYESWPAEHTPDWHRDVASPEDRLELLAASKRISGQHEDGRNESWRYN